MKQVVMKIVYDNGVIQSSLKSKDFPDESDLYLIRQCLEDLLEKADFNEDEIRSLLKPEVM